MLIFLSIVCSTYLRRFNFFYTTLTNFRADYIYNVKGLNWCRWYKISIPWLSCRGDNQLAIPRGFSSCTGWQTPWVGSLIFFIRRLGPSTYRSTPTKNMRNFKPPQKILEILATPQKNPQNLHTPQKILIFLKPPKYCNSNIEPQKHSPSLRMYENIRVPFWGQTMV